MPDTPTTQPTATVAGQSIALHVTGYPDIPNRWGAGHIRVTGIRLDYGNSHTPNGRQVFVTGLWVRDDGHATDNPVDRYYDAHDGDMSDWPDWIADLTRTHDPDRPPTLREMEQRCRPNTPPSRPEPHTGAAAGLVPRAVRPLDIEHDELMARAEAEHQARTGAEQARKNADRAAVLLWAADFAEEVAEKLRAHHEFERSSGALDVMTELRRLAAEAQQQPATETDEVALLRLTLDAVEEGRRELRSDIARLRSQLWTLAAVFEGFGRLLATSSRDWGQYAPDAWLYAVICGWDCEETVHDETCTHGAMEEMQQRHGWDDKTVAKARRYRAVVHTLTAPAAAEGSAAADTSEEA